MQLLEVQLAVYTAVLCTFFDYQQGRPWDVTITTSESFYSVVRNFCNFVAIICST